MRLFIDEWVWLNAGSLVIIIMFVVITLISTFSVGIAESFRSQYQMMTLSFAIYVFGVSCKHVCCGNSNHQLGGEEEGGGA